MNMITVSISVDQAQKDLVDALIILKNDLIAKKGSAILSDELPSVLKLGGEISELVTAFKSKDSFGALAYLISELAK
jgi:hypothetical protein